MIVWSQWSGTSSKHFSMSIMYPNKGRLLYDSPFYFSSQLSQNNMLSLNVVFNRTKSFKIKFIDGSVVV